MPVFTGSKIGGLGFGGGQAVSSPVSQYTNATGGVINEYSTPTGDIYRSHTFNTSGSLVVSQIGNADGGGTGYDILCVGGGGGGGSSGGGGGAGMLVYAADQTIAAQTYPITVGQGGYGATGTPGTTGGGSQGGQTTFASPTATLFYAPGGGGGGSHNQDGYDGGSGGGHGRDGSGTVGDGEGSPHPGGIDVESPSPQSTTSGFGRPGGDGPPNSGPGCGGGGGGGAASDGSLARSGPTSSNYGLGGDGARYTIADGTNIYYAGGGGGANYPPVPSPYWTNAGTGNPGGNGGYEAFSQTAPGAWKTFGQPGLSGRGGGGGGGSGPGGATTPGANGGDGTVIVRYKIGATHTAKASGGLISAYNGKIIHTFLNSGTFTTDAGFNETVEYFVQGGGGGGGWDFGGGGGAGGQMQSTGPLNTPTSTAISMTIGRGGYITTIENANAPNATPQRSEGANSVASFPSPIGTITAGGGGGGGYPASTLPSRPGGAGSANKGCGGGARGNGNDPGGAANGEGTAGGDASTGTGAGGGGGIGGPGEDGGEGSPSNGGNGGAGLQLPTTFRDPNSTIGYPGPGPSGFWVGGGGGGSVYTTGTVGSGGNSPDPANPWAGGGAGGQDDPHTQATHAATNSGAGGGGGASGGPALERSGGVGGSGFILIAYPE